MIKIIAGKYKGRVIPTYVKADYRPSTGRFREALFSILSSGEFGENKILPNGNILDLYSGTGSLSFEALSRGAKSATLVDINEEYLKLAKNFAEKIGETNISFLKMSAINLAYTGKRYNLVFMDPPYGNNLVPKTIKSLIKAKWLEDDAIIVAELEKHVDVEENKHVILLDERKYGNSKMIIFRYGTIHNN
jgi:16S rRNA (guanine966-N2)-methyltransferase